MGIRGFLIKLFLILFAVISLGWWSRQTVQAQTLCQWYQPQSSGKGCQEINANSAPLATCEKLIVNYPGIKYICCCAPLKKNISTPSSSKVNAALPTIANPFDNLQVKIPGMKRFSDALVTKDETTGQYKIQTAWIAEYLAGLYGYIISIVGILAAMTFIIGAVIYLTSAGNASRVGEAKSWMISSVFGLILALSSYLILYLINPALVTFRGLTIQAVQEDNYTPTAGAGELTGTYTGRPSFTKNNNTYDTLIKQAADQYKVDPTLVKAIMIAESNGRANALSSVGARGLMQLMPGTAKNLGFNIEDLYDPASSLMAGSKYLASLYSRACNGQTGNEVCNVNDWRYIIAAYNGGPGANKPSKSCPGLTYWECMVNVRYGQTRSYVNKVIANYNYLKQQGW